MLLATALLIVGLLLVVYSADRLVFAASILCRTFGIPAADHRHDGGQYWYIVTRNHRLACRVSARTTRFSRWYSPRLKHYQYIADPRSGCAGSSFYIHSDVLRRELPLMLLVSVVAGSVLYDGQLSRSDGIFLLFLAVLWLLFIVKLARQAERQGTDSLTREQLAELPRDGGLPVAFLWLGIALIIMPVATRMVVDNATVLANYFAISELTMGLTAIAIGTSLPELATAIAGVRKGENDIAVGNIIGANIFNIVIVLGLPALITARRD